MLSISLSLSSGCDVERVSRGSTRTQKEFGTSAGPPEEGGRPGHWSRSGSRSRVLWCPPRRPEPEFAAPSGETFARDKKKPPRMAPPRVVGLAWPGCLPTCLCARVLGSAASRPAGSFFLHSVARRLARASPPLSGFARRHVGTRARKHASTQGWRAVCRPAAAALRYQHLHPPCHVLRTDTQHLHTRVVSLVGG